jgi:putative transposase
VERLRLSVQRNRPFGDDSWMVDTARRLGLQASLRPLGRPRKAAPEQASLFADDAEQE